MDFEMRVNEILISLQPETNSLRQWIFIVGFSSTSSPSDLSSIFVQRILRRDKEWARSFYEHDKIQNKTHKFICRFVLMTKTVVTTETNGRFEQFLFFFLVFALKDRLFFGLSFLFSCVFSIGSQWKYFFSRNFAAGKK